MLHAIRVTNLINNRGVVFGGLMIAIVLALLPMQANAQCAQWDAGGQWELQQNNGFIYRMELSQNGKSITGKASYSAQTSEKRFLGVVTGGNNPVFRTHDVNGNIEGNDFYVVIGTAGVYRGTVGPSGRMDGTTYDANKPSSKANWFSSRAMKCMPPPTQPVTPKVIRSSGKAKVAPTPAPPPTPPFIVAGQPMIFAPTAALGSVYLGWDGGPDHPNVEVWLSMNNGAEIPAFSMGQGPQSALWKLRKVAAIELRFQRYHHYKFILKSGGKTLSTAAFVVP